MMIKIGDWWIAAASRFSNSAQMMFESVFSE